MAGTAKTLLLVFLLAVAATSTPAAATTLTLHNLCPYPVWPLVTPNTGFPAISENTGRLDGAGRGLVSIRFPDSFWAGRVVARTGCSSAPSRCETGSAPPATVVQLVVHAEGQDLAAYSVSLVDGFNVPAVVSPQAVAAGGGQCPALGCAADLNAGCPRSQRVVGAGGGVVACKGPAGYFKERCPLTRTTATDVEPVPQRCFAPGELKVVFCQSAMVNAAAGEPGRIRTVVADN
ncbi:unnamed protein product [Miscanthus lutarioriparius]|uniref:Osmotin-like protein n=1 Tax=Miscanthus lutarioriparius TaxID=422564 RepID=A0A811RBK2_9POAL|nr:unnamed protein product [Miscanthus lutarioriparius]